MKDSWLLYEYLRRWWRLLLMGTIIGALIGLAYYQSQDHPAEFKATALVAVHDATSPAEGALPAVLVRVDAGSTETERAAIDLVTSAVAKMSEFSGSQLILRDILTDERPMGPTWWKPAVFGSFIVLMATIGTIYVWTDVEAFGKQNQSA